MPARSRAPVSAGTGPSTDSRASSARSRVRETEHGDGRPRTGRPAGRRTTTGRPRRAPRAPRPPQTSSGTRAVRGPPAPRWTPGRPPGSPGRGHPLHSAGSSTARTPCPIRCARERRGSGDLPGPPSSPPCGTPPARRDGDLKARAKSSAPPRRSSLDSPNPPHRGRRNALPVGPGCARRRVPGAVRRDHHPMSDPGGPAASPAASSISSTVGVSPPNRGAYVLGSTCSSSQPDPSTASSSAASRNSRRMSSSVADHRPREVVELLETKPAASSVRAAPSSLRRVAGRAAERRARRRAPAASRAAWSR